MKLPEGPDAYELERIIMHYSALVELRASDEDRDEAEELVARIDTEIQTALDSPTKHRDWKAARPRIEQLVTQLDQLLYYQQPESMEGA
ncbi:MAG TPA: hypothetical protein VKU60_02180 [Chloroflexota bacterium]|nr:hypothetical protein [Chloroflexota bacterium]